MIKERISKIPAPVFAASFFCLGIFLESIFNLGFFVLYAGCAALVLLALFLLNNKTRFTLLILFFFLLLGAAILKNTLVLPENHISKMTIEGKGAVYLTGVVDSDPVGSERKTYFILDAREIEFEGLKTKTCGRVMVNDFAKRSFDYGQLVRIEGHLYKPVDFDADQASRRFSYKTYLKHQGIYNILSATTKRKIELLDGDFSNPIKKIAYKLRHKLHKIIFENLSFVQANLLAAILLGERQNMPGYINDYFIRTGTAHILAISGLHVGIVAFIVLVLFKALNLKRKPRFILAILFLILYCVMTGARPSVIRATVMAIILLVGYTIDREYNIYNALGLSAIGILFINPWQLFEVGFQLSFLSVIFIVWLSPKIQGMFFRGEKLKPGPRRFLISSFSVSASAWLGTSGPIAYYFSIISPVTIFANLVIVPYMSLVIAGGMALILAGILAPFLLGSISISANFIMSALIIIAKFFSGLPFAYFYLR